MNGTGYFDSLDRVYVIAEAGVNHNGEMTKAIKLIEMAKKAGADRKSTRLNSSHV